MDREVWLQSLTMRCLPPLALIIPTLILSLTGCGRTTSLNMGTDSGGGDTTPKGGFPGDFCNGGNKVVINGTQMPLQDIAGFGHPQMSCCNELGRLVFRFPPQGGKTPFIQVTPAIHSMGPVTTPLTVDLSKLPGDWYLLTEYFLCKDTTHGLCSRAEGLVDTLSNQSKDSFQGTLQVTGAGSNRRITLCMMASKGSSAPPYLQQVKAWANGVLIPK